MSFLKLQLCQRQYNLIYITIYLLILVNLTTCILANNNEKQRPNIIFIMADDMGVGEVGLFPSKNPHGNIDTPNLDMLATEGIRFTQAYAGYTVCAPSRTTLFTGRHSGNFLKYNLSGTAIKPDEIETLPKYLKSAGYNTALVGKSAPLTSPIESGFDYFIGQIDQSACHNMYPYKIDYDVGKQVELKLNQENKRSRENCMSNPSAYNYTVDITQSHSINWIHSIYQDKNPFFLYMSFTVPHAGGWGSSPKDPEQGAPVPSDLQYANENTWPDVEKDHAAVITYLDHYVGDIIQTLQKLHIDNNTLIIFASDNGAHLEGGHDYKFFNSTGGLKGHKRSLFEGGVRSPTLIRWPNVVKPNQVSNLQFGFFDILPTLCDIGGCFESLPKDLDGISIYNELKGEPQEDHEYIMFTWNGLGVPPIIQSTSNNINLLSKSGYSIRVGNFKGIVPFCNDGVTNQPSMKDDMQLYNLINDPFEENDVSDVHKDVVLRLKTLIISKDVSCKCYQCGAWNEGIEYDS